jgi:hypothetical protein
MEQWSSRWKDNYIDIIYGANCTVIGKRLAEHVFGFT